MLAWSNASYADSLLSYWPMAGRHLWSYSFQPPFWGRINAKCRSGCSGLWAEYAESTLSGSLFHCLILEKSFFSHVLVIIVPHPLIVLLQEEHGCLFCNLLSGSRREWSYSSAAFSALVWTPPVLSASTFRMCSSPCWLTLAGLSPRMSANHVASCWSHQVWVCTFAMTQVAHTPVCNVW